jgi:predicted TIM-barrel fold metal-dependent hydrolase
VAFFEAGCEWIPFILDKMQHRYDLSPSRYGYVGQRSPYDYARSEQVYFGFEVDDQLLPFVLELVGDERFMYASDIPHSDREFDAAGDLMRRDDVSDSAKRKLLADNAVRFYGL